LHTHHHDGRLFASELHLGHSSIPFKGNLAKFQGHVVGSNATLLPQVILDCLLDRRFGMAPSTASY
jgi:hypothetical protein